LARSRRAAATALALYTLSLSDTWCNTHLPLLCVQAFGEITARSSNCTSPAQLRQTTPQLAVVGLFRDLRGIAAATATRRWVDASCSCSLI
jgi:hypothetical protein